MARTRRNLKFDAKHAREIAKAQVIGAEKGHLQVDKVKFNANNIGLQLKKRLLEIEPKESSKFLATVGVAIAIKQGIDWVQVKKEEYKWLLNLGRGAMFPTLIYDSYEKDEKGNFGSEVVEWLLSYGLAYLIVENFGAIVTAVGTGLTSIVGLAKSLMGAGALVSV